MAKGKDLDWKPSKEYIQPNYNHLEKLNEFLYGEYIRDMQKKMEDNAIANFKVTKLPAGTPESHEEFKPEYNAYGTYKGKGMQKKENVERDTENIYKSREEKFLAGDLEDAK
jgi:hypothetical protein